MRYQILTAFTVVLTLVCLGATGAKATGGAEEVLASKGLTKVGTTWLVEGDVKLREGLRTMRQAKRKLDESINRRIELEKQIRWADQVMDELAAEDQNVSNQMAKAQGVPFRYNQLAAQSNALGAKMHDAQRFQEDRKAELAKIVDPRDDYVVAVLDLSDKMEVAARQYQTLATDPDLSAAIARLNAKGGPKVKLGPSDAFAQELPGVRRERASVNMAAIKFNNDNHTPQVDVTLNGKLTVSMTLDSGASDVCIGWVVAKELGITPGAGDRVVKTVIANGTTADAYVKVLDTVRLGPFTAEHVECIVAPESEKNAPNLLGGSFLQNFVYKMDLSAGEVRLSQVAGKNNPKDLRGTLVGAAPGRSVASHGPEGASSSGSSKVPPAPAPGTPPVGGEGGRRADGKWVILFRSVYPSLWDTPMNDGHSYSIPLDEVPATIAYLRLRNARGDFVIIPLTRDELRTKVVRDKSGWEGRSYDKNGARHLGIFVKSMSRVQTGSIDVTQGTSGDDYTGYGFGNRVRRDDVQGYVWAGKPVEKGDIEIAVTGEPLTAAEKERLLNK